MRRLSFCPSAWPKEASVPGLYTSVRHGMWFPKATPKEAIAKLNAAIVECLAE
jgi:tripartite-type tricarboxylate transporter receptor subunit TctC